MIFLTFRFKQLWNAALTSRATRGELQKGEQTMTDRQDRYYTEAGWSSILAAWSVCVTLFLFAALGATSVHLDQGDPSVHAQLAADSMASEW